jgi:hypothetical protein
MEIVDPSETLVVVYQTTRRRTTEGSNPRFNILIMLLSNLKSSTGLISSNFLSNIL